MHPKTRQQVLLGCFARSLKDPFPPSRIAGINAIAATQQFYTVAETGGRVLPVLCPAMVDPEKSVREQAFRVVRGFVGKLEKVSDDPSLREEMEKEVAAGAGAVAVAGAAAATWASWAVGAATAKFFKSPAAQSTTENSPTPEGTTSKETTPDKVATEMKQTSLGPSTSASTQKESVKEHAVNSGWDAQEDGWDNEEVSDDKDGWDEDEDWGSLEESSNKPEAEPKTASWGEGFNQGTKSHDAFSPVQQTSSGWDEWGSGGAVDSKDDARKRREEKKAERLKEIEAKRAAKKGPMRLGKKMID